MDKELLELKNYAYQWVKLNFNMELDAEIEFNPILLNRRINGRYVPNGNTIEISPQLFKLNPVAAKAVLKHELTHWRMFKLNLPAYDNLTPFETQLKLFGLITNGNYPRTLKVVLAHQTVKVITCGRCRMKMFEVLELDDFKIPDNVRLLCNCNRSPRMIVGKPMVVYYKTYEYLLYNNEEDVYQLSGDFMLHKDYSLIGGHPREGINPDLPTFSSF